MSTPDLPATLPRPGTWLQFSLRGLLALTALVAMFFGWREWRLGPVRRQAAARAAIQDARAEVCLTSSPDPRPGWEESWFGIPPLDQFARISLQEPAADSPVWEHVATLQPARLRLHQAQLTRANIQAIARISKLQELELSLCRLSEVDLRELRCLESLEAIVFDDDNVPPDALAACRTLPSLTHLSIATVRPVSREQAAALSGCPKLQVLDCTLLSGSFPLAALRDLPALERLEITIDLDDAALAELSRFESLTALPHSQLTSVSDAGLESLSRLKRVEEVSIDSPLVTDRGIAALAGCTGLKKLTLRDVQLTDAGLAAIARMPALEDLTLIKVGVTDAGLAHLAPAMPRLRVLKLIDTSVTGSGFRRFAASFPDRKVHTEGHLELSR